MKTLTLLVFAGLLAGCSIPNPVGPRVTQTVEGTTSESAPPTVLSVTDKNKTGVAQGTGPAEFTSITGGEIQTITTGMVTRKLYLDLPDGTKLNLASGSDIRGKGIKIEPATGAVTIDEFSTVSSEPLRANNEGLDRFIKIVESLTPAQRDAQIAYWQEQSKMAQGITKSVIDGIIAGLTGGVK